MAVWCAQAGAFLARPFDESEPAAYVEEQECSEKRRWHAEHARLLFG